MYLCTNFFHGEKLQKMNTTSLIVKKLPEENPIGENSPNLVTLVGGWGEKPLILLGRYPLLYRTCRTRSLCLEIENNLEPML
jgi:hypothetical protein